MVHELIFVYKIVLKCFAYKSFYILLVITSLLVGIKVLWTYQHFDYWQSGWLHSFLSRWSLPLLWYLIYCELSVLNCQLLFETQLPNIFNFGRLLKKYVFVLSSLNSFMFSSTIRTISLFRSSIVLDPSSPRLEVKLIINALILLISSVNPLFSPSAFVTFEPYFL